MVRRVAVWRCGGARCRCLVGACVGVWVCGCGLSDRATILSKCTGIKFRLFQNHVFPYYLYGCLSTLLVDSNLAIFCICLFHCVPAICCQRALNSAHAKTGSTVMRTALLCPIGTSSTSNAVPFVCSGGIGLSGIIWAHPCTHRHAQT
eukprot:COSAG02_NODE_2201_length_9535_cov_20.999364_7_plen_148_part_00